MRIDTAIQRFRQWQAISSAFRISAALLFSLASHNAAAACSRPLEVPVAPLGFSIVVDGDKSSGAFVEFIQQVSAIAGCEIRMRPVPRARLEYMFLQGEADLLLASTPSDKRDQAGRFIPLVRSRAVMVSLDHARPAIHSLAELLATPGLRVAVVRGLDYGPAYQDALAQLDKQKRLFREKDPTDIARMLKAKMADVTILPPATLYGAAVVDQRVYDIATSLRIEPLDEMPWSFGGLYISKKVPQADRDILEKAIQEANRGNALLHAYQRYYPPDLIAAGTRAL